MPAESNLIIYGGGAFSSAKGFKDAETDEDFSKVFKALKDANVDKIDVAQLYGNGHAEEMIGKFKALDQGFGVDTKWVGGWKGEAWASKQKIIDTTQESYQRLGSSKEKQVDIFYIHSPDIWTPFEETLAGVQKAYEDGGFKRFGLSNFTPDQVRKVLRICKENGYVKPTVFQGSYAAVARGIEDEILPLLRENGIALYAYSPIAGGFLVSPLCIVQPQILTSCRPRTESSLKKNKGDSTLLPQCQSTTRCIGLTACCLFLTIGKKSQTMRVCRKQNLRIDGSTTIAL